MHLPVTLPFLGCLSLNFCRFVEFGQDHAGVHTLVLALCLFPFLADFLSWDDEGHVTSSCSHMLARRFDLLGSEDTCHCGARVLSLRQVDAQEMASDVCGFDAWVLHCSHHRSNIRIVPLLSLGRRPAHLLTHRRLLHSNLLLYHCFWRCPSITSEGIIRNRVSLYHLIREL